METKVTFSDLVIMTIWWVAIILFALIIGFISAVVIVVAKIIIINYMD